MLLEEVSIDDIITGDDDDMILEFVEEVKKYF